MSRAFLVVMDSVGIGGATDAAAFGDVGADTLGHIAAECAAGRADEGRSGALQLPNLDALGLGRAAELATGIYPPGFSATPTGPYASANQVSNGKDTPSGHWELAGMPVPFDWHYFPDAHPAFPQDKIAEMIAAAGLLGILGDCRASGTKIIEDLGEEHLRSGKPIVYTSADSVVQIAAHETAFGLKRLYALCEIAAKIFHPMMVGRVIARPFLGETAASFKRTPNRHDYAITPPEKTLCNRVVDAGGRTLAIGKIGDIFAMSGISKVFKGKDDMALFDHLLALADSAQSGDFVFANFVEFDSEYGHRRDVPGYARALERFDACLPTLLAKMQRDDLLIITADHGNDPTWHGTEHTRERVPVLVHRAGLNGGSLGQVGFVQVGETIAAHLGLAQGKHGRSFL